MNTTEKGDQLEDEFYAYLIGQQAAGLLVYDLYPSEKCKIYKKKKYYCNQRERDIEFDVVIELRRTISSQPHLFVVFECKNHKGSIKEREVTDFSDKITRVFGHAGKGIFVVTNKLQSGAINLIDKRKIGIVKFAEHGFEVTVDRQGTTYAERQYVKDQIFDLVSESRSLKFSAYFDGKCIGSPTNLLLELDPNFSGPPSAVLDNSVPFLSNDNIANQATALLSKIGYSDGPVNLEKACAFLSVELIYTARTEKDAYGNRILGTANFDRRVIKIYDSETELRERFTIGHEIGHFFLKHAGYLRSEATTEKDLFIKSSQKAPNFQRLESQANKFSSEFLLPAEMFAKQLAVRRSRLGIQDRGHGYLFVDDQSCNYLPYNQLLSDISDYFKVSKQVIEIRLRNYGLLNDQRYKAKSVSHAMRA